MDYCIYKIKSQTNHGGVAECFWTEQYRAAGEVTGIVTLSGNEGFGLPGLFARPLAYTRTLSVNSLPRRPSVSRQTKPQKHFVFLTFYMYKIKIVY